MYIPAKKKDPLYRTHKFLREEREALEAEEKKRDLEMIEIHRRYIKDLCKNHLPHFQKSGPVTETSSTDLFKRATQM